MFAFIDEVQLPLLGNRKSFDSIQQAKFIGDVKSYVAQPDFHSDVQTAINLHNILYNKYNVQAWKLEEKRTNVIMRLESAKANLSMVDRFMRKPGEEHQNLMQVAEGVYRSVTVLPVEKVILQVDQSSTLQMEFSLPEAVEFLRKDITKLQQQRLQIEHDMDYLEDQENITELNMAVLKNTQWSGRNVN